MITERRRLDQSSPEREAASGGPGFCCVAAGAEARHLHGLVRSAGG
jgi:hypothetical protein